MCACLVYVWECVIYILLNVCASYVCVNQIHVEYTYQIYVSVNVSYMCGMC